MDNNQRIQKTYHDVDYCDHANVSRKTTKSTDQMNSFIRSNLSNYSETIDTVDTLQEGVVKNVDENHLPKEISFNLVIVEYANVKQPVNYEFLKNFIGGEFPGSIKACELDISWEFKLSFDKDPITGECVGANFVGSEWNFFCACCNL